MPLNKIVGDKKYKKNKTRKKRLYERIASMCEVPSDLVSSIPVFEIRGHHEIEISGCDGILEYNDNSIILTIGKDRFNVCGEYLVLTDFRDGVLFVRGNIKSASFGTFSCDENTRTEGGDKNV